MARPLRNGLGDNSCWRTDDGLILFSHLFMGCFLILRMLRLLRPTHCLYLCSNVLV